MITQGFSEPWRGRAVVVAVAALGLAMGLALMYAARRASTGAAPAADRSISAQELAALRLAADGGDAAALASLVDALNRAPAPPSNDVRATVADMLLAAWPEVRAAACAWIGRHAQRDLAWLLLPRMNDADWRVRAAAFDAMQRVGGDLPGAPRSPPPLRDTPADEREPFLFAWINGWQETVRPGAGATTQPALAELCEIYAPSGGHWLTGTKLAQSCLACHAPPDAYAESDFAACADCHRSAHDEFFRSSHARSTTHLNLLRVNERLKQVERLDPGPREGLVCTSCHVPSKHATAPLPPGSEGLTVPHRFAPAVACATCHAETQGEWEAWRRSPRPIPSRWLPGEFTWDESADVRTCVSCHMEPRPSRGAGAGAGASAGDVERVHAFASRRDVTMMRGGLSAYLEPPTAGRGPRLVLTNLAGHRYPSGTIRRALRIELRYDTDAEDSTRLLARLTDSPVPTSQPTQPALAPGEQRRMELPIIPGATRVTCEITYERNQYEPGAYELPLHTLSGNVTNPVGRER